MTSKPAPVSDIIGGSVKKLEELSAVIARENALKDKETETLKIKENEKLNAPPSPISAPEGIVFEPSPQLKKITANGLFHGIKFVANLFQKDLRPLNPEQQASLEESVAPLLSKMIPASFNQHQDKCEILFIIGGIVMSNLTNLSDNPADKPADKPPVLPATPESKVTVITADAPPLPKV